MREKVFLLSCLILGAHELHETKNKSHVHTACVHCGPYEVFLTFSVNPPYN